MVVLAYDTPSARCGSVASGSGCSFCCVVFDVMDGQFCSCFRISHAARLVIERSGYIRVAADAFCFCMPGYQT